MNKKNMILMSTLLVCSLECFAQSDAEVTDSLWKDVDLNAVTVVASKPLVKMETDKMTYNGFYRSRHAAQGTDGYRGWTG